MKRVFVLFVFLFFFLPVKACAADFSIANDVTYSILNDHTTHTLMRIALTNTTSQYFATEYRIKLGFSNISRINSSDPDGSITPEVEKTSDGYTIKVVFNKKVVGIGKVLPFVISFDTTDIVQTQGSIYEVNIPGISEQNDFSSFNAKVTVPDYFGQPLYMKPDTGSSSLSFSKEQLKSGGISIAFGKNQVYTLKLSYHIKNSHVYPVRTEIALPPNTNYQDVSIESIDPAPKNVVKDADGNWLAQYSLGPSQDKTVYVEATIKTYLSPRIQEESEEQLTKYLQPKDYWESDNVELKKIAASLKTPEAIYDYVVKHLSYDFSGLDKEKDRLGAIGALTNPKSAVCLEFTDLFIALFRAAGIPARSVEGYGYAQNSQKRPLSLLKDVLHAWPEYYDRKSHRWIMVDPTWENTTQGIDYFHVLDFDHIAFVVKGLDSQYPVPAGGYKSPGNENTKDVLVSFGQDDSFAKPKLSTSLYLPKWQIAGVPVAGSILVRNTGSVVAPKSIITLRSLALSPKNQEIAFSEIPPYGFVVLPFSYTSPSLFTDKNDIITMRLDGQEKENQLRIVPFFLVPLYDHTVAYILGGIFVTTFLLVILIFARKSRRISF